MTKDEPKFVMPEAAPDAQLLAEMRVMLEHLPEKQIATAHGQLLGLCLAQSAFIGPMPAGVVPERFLPLVERFKGADLDLAIDCLRKQALVAESCGIACPEIPDDVDVRDLLERAKLEFGAVATKDEPLEYVQAAGKRVPREALREALERKAHPQKVADRCVEVSLVHFDADGTPAHINHEPILGDITAEQLANVAMHFASDAEYHALSFKTEQSYAFVLYAEGDRVLQQIRFALPCDRRVLS